MQSSHRILGLPHLSPSTFWTSGLTDSVLWFLSRPIDRLLLYVNKPVTVSDSASAVDPSGDRLSWWQHWLGNTGGLHVCSQLLSQRTLPWGVSMETRRLSRQNCGQLTLYIPTSQSVAISNYLQISCTKVTLMWHCLVSSTGLLLAIGNLKACVLAIQYIRLICCMALYWTFLGYSCFKTYFVEYIQMPFS